MYKLGGTVTGIDASLKNIEIAKLHAQKQNLKINYICASPENLNIENKFDIILNMEIVEHVEDINIFVKKSSEFLKKNGIMFIATLNKTLKSYIFAILGAEYILRWLPIGTHEWSKFVEPKKLIEICKDNSLEIQNENGMTYNPFMDEWRVSKDQSVNYIVQLKKV